MAERGKTVAVVGSGLGGLSAAISLAQEGYTVEVFEKNAQIGGKLNVLSDAGYSFDLGPSILTLPHIFERLFERSGKRMADYFTIRPLRPHWQIPQQRRAQERLSETAYPHRQPGDRGQPLRDGAGECRRYRLYGREDIHLFGIPFVGV